MENKISLCPIVKKVKENKKYSMESESKSKSKSKSKNLKKIIIKKIPKTPHAYILLTLSQQKCCSEKKKKP